MAATPSTMLPLGTRAPDFQLPEVRSSSFYGLRNFEHQDALLVIFLCAHCPYVLHVVPELARLALDYSQMPLAIVGITSNDIDQYPQDAPEPTARFATEHGLTFPILYDSAQATARAYSAACTPDFFLFNAARQLVYRGQLDASRPSRGPDRPGSGELNGSDLRAAIEAALAHQPVSEIQKPSIGCSIKWKPGNEPR